MSQPNPHKSEFARRQLQKMTEATATQDEASRQVAVQRQARNASQRRSDIDVIRNMAAVINHVQCVQADLQSKDEFRANPTYKEWKWLVSVAMTVGDAPAGIRELVHSEAMSSRSHVYKKAALLGTKQVLGYASTAVGIGKKLTQPGTAAYVHSVLAANSPLGLDNTIVAKAGDAVMTAIGHAGGALQIASSAAALVSASGHGLLALSMQDRLNVMSGIAENYEGHCECCDAAHEISLGLMANLTGTTYDMMPMVGTAHSLANLASNLLHSGYKKSGGKSHRPTYFIAKTLWQAARSPEQPGHRHCGHAYDSRLPRASTGQACPLAYLILATLFGGGNPYMGIKKAVAAVMADEKEAVDKVKKRVADRFGCVFSRGTSNKIGAQATVGTSWYTP